MIKQRKSGTYKHFLKSSHFKSENVESVKYIHADISQISVNF